MIDNPVFIVGSERSGSNLLRVILNEMPGLAVPHPPHLMRDLSPLLARFGDLSLDKNMRRLVQDAIQLVRLHFAPWPITLNVDSILSALPARDLYSVYATIYDAYRESQKKARWGCKSTFMIRNVQDVLMHHKQPQFIHLVRDVRDVAASAKHSVFSHYHPYLVAQLWKREQAIAAKWRHRLPATTWHTLRYEDLLAHPERAVQGLCKFLNEAYRPEILNYFERSATCNLAKLSRSWQNVARPILRENTQKFRQELTLAQTALIEQVARTEMTALNYQPEANAKPIQIPGRFKVQAQENLTMLREEARALLRDRNSVQRFKKKFYLLKVRVINRAQARL